MKIVGAAPAIVATREFGFSAVETRLQGLVLGVAALLFPVPMTRSLGAILLTGCLGGAAANNWRHASPWFSHILFDAYVGVAVWASIWLRIDGLRQFMPFQRSSAR
jgi:hypothetical protein